MESTVDVKTEYKMQIVWKNVAKMSALHTTPLFLIYYLYKHPEERANAYTLIKFNLLYLVLISLGVTAGAHRLWSHRSYKARWPLRLFLALGFAGAGQNDLYVWCRDHRVHHKFSETDADPHNAKRGFFFSHIGWLLVKKHPDVLKKGSTIDFSDLLQDPIIRLQRKYYWPLTLVMLLGIPVVLPWYNWMIPFYHSTLFSLVRYLVQLHATWLVNSAAHISGSRPYDVTISPREQNFWKVFIPTGEMYHNFHHTFPCDYKASEFGWIGQINVSAFFIELMALLGLAYDLKTTPHSLIQKRKERTGEGAISLKNVSCNLNLEDTEKNY